MPKLAFGIFLATKIFNTPWFWGPSELELEKLPISFFSVNGSIK